MAARDLRRVISRVERVVELEATLRDIVMGADIMLQPMGSATLTGAFRNYVIEVKRVAEEGLQ